MIMHNNGRFWSVRGFEKGIGEGTQKPVRGCHRFDNIDRHCCFVFYFVFGC